MDIPSRGASCKYSSQDEETKCPTGNAINVMSLHTEGLTCAKKDLILRLTKDHDVGILFLQGTHQRNTGITIPNFETVF